MAQPPGYEPDEATIAARAKEIRKQKLQPDPAPTRFRRPRPPKRRASLHIGREFELLIHGICVPPEGIALTFDRPVKVLFDVGMEVFLKRQMKKPA